MLTESLYELAAYEAKGCVTGWPCKVRLCGSSGRGQAAVTHRVAPLGLRVRTARSMTQYFAHIDRRGVGSGWNVVYLAPVAHSKADQPGKVIAERA